MGVDASIRPGFDRLGVDGIDRSAGYVDRPSMRRHRLDRLGRMHRYVPASIGWAEYVDPTSVSRHVPGWCRWHRQVDRICRSILGQSTRSWLVSMASTGRPDMSIGRRSVDMSPVGVDGIDRSTGYVDRTSVNRHVLGRCRWHRQVGRNCRSKLDASTPLRLGRYGRRCIDTPRLRSTRSIWASMHRYAPASID